MQRVVRQLKVEHNFLGYLNGSLFFRRSVSSSEKYFLANKQFITNHAARILEAAKKIPWTAHIWLSIARKPPFKRPSYAIGSHFV